MDINFDFSEIEREIEAYEENVLKQMEKRAKEAIEVAKETGTYRDVTGRLRASNDYVVDDDGVTLVNTAPYAKDVEARGEVVLSSAVLYLEKKLKEDFE